MDKHIDISIIIPAFNESRRLPAFLEQVIAYCRKDEKAYEIIVVDDRSRDKTSSVAGSYQARFPGLRVIRNECNRGKGYSVKKGMLNASGDVRVFLDADGSTQPAEIGKNLHYLNEGYDIVVGSRVLRDTARSVKARWYRTWIGHVFNFCVRTFLFRDIQDTQCGFKMFKKESVEPLFSRVYLHGFGFDIELLYLAFKMGYKVKEAPVDWRHVPGSKINLLLDSFKMLVNIFQVRNWHCTPINRYSKHMGPDEYRFMYRMEEHHWWFTSRRKFVMKLLRRLDYQNPKILDVGSGTGANLLALKELGEATGLDVSEQAVAFCRKRGLADVALGPVEQMPFETGAFDITACLDVLEHTVDPVRVLREVRRVLKDSGKIVITVPAFQFLWSQHDEALCHRRRYEKRTLLEDLNEAGFQTEKIGYFFCLSFFAVAPIRMVRRLFVKKGVPCSDTTTLPPKIFNGFLKALFQLEMGVALTFGLPFGTTLYAVAAKRQAGPAQHD